MYACFCYDLVNYESNNLVRWFTCCSLLASENVRCENQDAQEAPARAEEPKEAEAVAVPEDCLL